MGIMAVRTISKKTSTLLDQVLQLSQTICMVKEATQVTVIRLAVPHQSSITRLELTTRPQLKFTTHQVVGAVSPWEAMVEMTCPTNSQLLDSRTRIQAFISFLSNLSSKIHTNRFSDRRHQG